MKVRVQAIEAPGQPEDKRAAEVLIERIGAEVVMRAYEGDVRLPFRLGLTPDQAIEVGGALIRAAR